MSNVSPKFEATVAKLLAAEDLEGLIALRGNRVVAEEMARMTFSRNRSPKNGEAYRRRGAEKSLVKSAIYQLESKKKPVEEQELDEAGGLAAKLGDMAAQGVRNARDRVLQGVGNSGARARLDLNLVTKQLNKDWKYYATRKAAAFKDKRMLQEPVIGDLQKFLVTTYGWRLQAHQIKLILSGQGKSEESSLPKPTKPPVVAEPGAAEAPTSPEEPAAPEPKAPRKTADELAREALKHTSPEEYAALKRKFGKPTINKPTVAAKGPSDDMSMEDILKGKLRDKMRADMANESIIVEAYDDEELNEPFDLADFPRLADIMLDLGFFKVDRGGVITGGSADSGGIGGGTASTDAAPGPQTVSARVTPDGHSIDINNMRKMMENDGVTGQNVAALKDIVSKGPSGFGDLAGNGVAMKTMVSLVNALLGSINKDNSPRGIAASHSITPDKNVIDINVFAEGMKKLGVTGDAMNQIRQELASGGEQALMTILSKANNPQAKTVYNLALAATQAIKKVEPTKKKGA